MDPIAGSLFPVLTQIPPKSARDCFRWPSRETSWFMILSGRPFGVTSGPQSLLHDHAASRPTSPNMRQLSHPPPPFGPFSSVPSVSSVVPHQWLEVGKTCPLSPLPHAPRLPRRVFPSSRNLFPDVGESAEISAQAPTTFVTVGEATASPPALAAMT